MLIAKLRKAIEDAFVAFTFDFKENGTHNIVGKVGISEFHLQTDEDLRNFVFAAQGSAGGKMVVTLRAVPV